MFRDGDPTASGNNLLIETMSQRQLLETIFENQSCASASHAYSKNMHLLGIHMMFNRLNSCYKILTSFHAHVICEYDITLLLSATLGEKICIYTRFELFMIIYVVETLQGICLLVQIYLVSVAYYEAS